MLTEYQPVSEILVPMDFSACSEAALEFAKRLAAGISARLHLLYIDDDPIRMQSSTDQQFRDQHAGEMRVKFIDLLSAEDRERFRTITEIRCGTAYNEIETYAAEQGIELIVMGNIGRSAVVDILLGSVSSHVIRYANCPVLSVQQP